MGIILQIFWDWVCKKKGHVRSLAGVHGKRKKYYCLRCRRYFVVEYGNIVYL